MVTPRIPMPVGRPALQGSRATADVGVLTLFSARPSALPDDCLGPSDECPQSIDDLSGLCPDAWQLTEDGVTDRPPCLYQLASVDLLEAVQVVEIRERGNRRRVSLSERGAFGAETSHC